MSLHKLAEYVLCNGRVDGDPDEKGGDFAASLAAEMYFEMQFDEYDQWNNLNVTLQEIEEWVYARY